MNGEASRVTGDVSTVSIVSFITSFNLRHHRFSSNSASISNETLVIYVWDVSKEWFSNWVTEKMVSESFPGNRL